MIILLIKKRLYLTLVNNFLRMLLDSEVIALNCLSLHNCGARKFHSQQNMAYSSYVVCHPNDGFNGRYQRAKRRVCLEVKTITPDLQQQFTDTSTEVIKEADRTTSGFAIVEPFQSNHSLRAWDSCYWMILRAIFWARELINDNVNTQKQFSC